MPVRHEKPALSVCVCTRAGSPRQRALGVRAVHRNQALLLCVCVCVSVGEMRTTGKPGACTQHTHAPGARARARGDFTDDYISKTTSFI